MRYDLEEMNAAFPVSRVLDRFAIAHRGGRAACPLCGGSNSQAFCFGGRLRGFYCFACGATGTPVQLYASLGGMPVAKAITEIAGLLGLTASEPAEIAGKVAARMAEREREAAIGRTRSARLNWLVRHAREADTMARAHRALARGWGQSEVARGHIWAALTLEEHRDRWDRIASSV